MIQIIGLIVAAYALARLIQVPMEHMKGDGKLPLLLLVSIFGCLAIGALTIFLLGSSLPNLPK